MKKVPFFILFIFIASTGWATTYNVTCSGTITSALQTAVNSSSDNDIVNIGSGSCTSARVTWTDKSIILQGQGQGVTNISVTGGGFFTITQNTNAHASWRVTAMTLTASGSAMENILWANNTGTWSYGFRIDHLTVDNTGLATDGGIIAIFGPAAGLIDHVTAHQCGESHVSIGMGWNGENGSINNLYGSYGMSLPYEPGTAAYSGGSVRAVYIEDNTFDNTGCAAGTAIVDTSYTGLRAVIRRNTGINAAIYNHWTAGQNVNATWLEVYNNNWNWSGTDGIFPIMLRGGGTGIIYNNTLSGYGSAAQVAFGESRGANQGAPLQLCDGTHYWDGANGTNPDASAPGWPCLAQIGRAAGVTLDASGHPTPSNGATSFPLYMWNNGPQCSCSGTSGNGCSSGACDNTVSTSSSSNPYFKGLVNGSGSGHSTSGFGNGDYDFYTGTSQPSGAGTHTLTYTALQYPHPLQGASSPAGVPMNGTSMKGVSGKW